MLMFAILMAMFPKRLSKTKMNKIGIEQDTEFQTNEIIPSTKKPDKEEAARNGIGDQDRKQPDKFQLVDSEVDHVPTFKGINF